MSELRTIHRAFQMIQQATGNTAWEVIIETRRQDLLVYLALSQFSRRPKLRDLAPEVQEDIKTLLNTYKQACDRADQMLFSLGEKGVIATKCRTSQIGKRLPDALYVHVSALASLDPLLRLYEGCAARVIGRMEETTLVKFHIDQSKISYLAYPDFDQNPHPTLATSMQINLSNLRVSYRDYNQQENPPILHRKETFVTAEYPNYEKFARLTRQEKQWGLLDETRTIGTRQGWGNRLEQYSAELQGHRVIWRKDADAYRVKILRAQQRQRKQYSSDLNPPETCA